MAASRAAAELGQTASLRDGLLVRRDYQRRETIRVLAAQDGLRAAVDDTVGRQHPQESGREAAAGEVGEIVGRGPILMAGYYRRPEQTAEAVRDGWLYSGDLGYVDEDGYLHLVDRKKDMICSGGINVFPRDIEEVAVRHPAVREVAVFGVPDEKWGEAPLAAVVLRDTGAVSTDALKAWINERVPASYQRVCDVVFYEDFPRSAAGKTLKREMREIYWAGRAVKI